VYKDRVISLNQVIHWAVKPSSLLGLIDPFQEDSSKKISLILRRNPFHKEDERKAGLKAYIVGWLFVFPIPAATAGARNSWNLW
jgi:hypothetical protein